MSFSFQWPRFSEQFHKDAIQLLNNALNKGTKPPVIADKIEVVELEMGTQVRKTLILPASQIYNDTRLAAAPGTRNSRHWRPHYDAVSWNIQVLVCWGCAYRFEDEGPGVYALDV